MLTSYQWWLCVGEMIADTVITYHGLWLKAVLSTLSAVMAYHWEGTTEYDAP